MDKKQYVTLVMLFLLLFTGCAIKTAGKSTWTIFFGVTTEQQSDEPASVEIESSVVTKITDSLTDGKVSKEE